MKKKVKKTKLGQALIKGLKEAVVKNTFQDRLPRNRGEWLLICQNLTKRYLLNRTVTANDPIVIQCNRIADELNAWINNNRFETIRQFEHIYPTGANFYEPK